MKHLGLDPYCIVLEKKILHYLKKKKKKKKKKNMYQNKESVCAKHRTKPCVFTVHLFDSEKLLFLQGLAFDKNHRIDSRSDSHNIQIWESTSFIEFTD